MNEAISFVYGIRKIYKHSSSQGVGFYEFVVKFSFQKNP